MKKLLGLLFIGSALALVSCETTREITLKADGSGTLVTTTDMSGLIAIAKMSGQGKEIDSSEKSVDTTIFLDKVVDSIPDLTPAERELVKKGKLGLNLSMADEKLFTKLQFPFTSTNQISVLDQLSAKVMQQAMKKQMEGDDSGTTPPIPTDEMPKANMDEYFTITYAKGLIEKKHIPEKYADVANDKGMQSLKEMAGEGMPMNTTLIFNLPKPVKKAEGKNVKLSDDKRKVTIVNSVEDFFNDVTKLEFRIEY